MNRQHVDNLSRFVTEHKLALLDRNIRQRTRHLTVVLEDVYRGHNASACLRSCDCFGIQDVHVIENVNRFRENRDITLGATQWLTLFKYREHENNAPACIDGLKAKGYRIIATSPNAEGCRLEDYDVRQKTALLFGNEHRGLSQAALDHVDGFLRIPMFGFTESLNISVAVAVCLHHLTAKLRNFDVDWQLGEAEASELRATWVQKIVRKKLKHGVDLTEIVNS